jgi:ribonuclease P protein component, eubacterial
MQGWAFIMYKLAKRQILKKNSNFQTVYRTGKSYANRMMVMYVLPQADCGRRVGFAAGKRLGNAVVRNRVKRVLREVYRLHQSKLIDNVNLVLMGRQAMVKSNSNAAGRAFLDLCGKAKIIAKQV